MQKQGTGEKLHDIHDIPFHITTPQDEMADEKDDSVHGEESPLAALVRRAGLRNPTEVIAQLHRDHAVGSVEDLVDLLAHGFAAKALPELWRVRLQQAIDGSNSSRSYTPPPYTIDDTGSDIPATSSSPRPTLSRWQPVVDGPELIVLQGDLTTFPCDAIVNPANSALLHGGGAAAAIVRHGGQIIQRQSNKWIRTHKTLAVGHAMATTSGRLPCRFVVHCVGPRVGRRGRTPPTPEQAQQLRDAVWNSLYEAETRHLESIAMPGISSGSFGYPRDLATQEIVNECARYCSVQGTETTIKRITLLSIDEPTCVCFREALAHAAELAGGI